MSRLLPAVACFAATVALAQAEAPCPKSLPAGTVCHNGQDDKGAYYWIAKPANWNGMLVVHVHGGPRTPAPKLESPVEDLERWAIVVKEGYAWAGSSFRRGGYGVSMAAEDSENVRRIYVAKFGAPKRTILHGQSWGGGVAANLVERYPNYDAVLLTSGVLAVNSLAYNFRADLRAVYQYYCGNHPRPDEPQYPVWMGLPAGAKPAAGDVEKRVNECTGARLPPEQRSEKQRRNLANLTQVLKIPERSLVGHVNWATVLFQDIVHNRLGGRNPFSNTGVRYAGSDDDEALNKGVVRFEADSRAAAEFARDGDSQGRVSVPVLTMHAIADSVAFVEHESVYRERMERGGSSGRLVQAFTKESEHSYLSSPEYAAAFEALLKWVESGEKPSPRSLSELCDKHSKRHEGGCHFDVDYQPKPLETRQYPRP